MTTARTLPVSGIALALLTGLAANRSLETGAPVRVADLLTLP